MIDGSSSSTFNVTTADVLELAPRPITSRYQFLFFAVVAAFFVLAKSWTAYPLVFPESGNVQLLGVDSYFHLRHAQYSTEHFPEKMLYDA